MPNYQGNWVDPLAGDGKDRSHVLSLPYWTLFVRIGQLVLAFLLLILTAFAASKLGSDAAGFGLTWFTFIFTILYFVWLGVSLHSYPEAYHPLAHLPVEILLNIFWLCSWAVLASEAASIGDLENLVGSFTLSLLPTSYRSALNSVKASAALGALEWVLFSITLAFLVIAFINSTKSASPGVEAGVSGSDAKAATELQNYGAAGAAPADPSLQPAFDGQQQAAYPPQAAYVDPNQQAAYAAQQQQQAYPPQQQAYPQQVYAEQPPQQYQEQPVVGTPPPAQHPPA